MGRGDKRSTKGKRWRSSYGNCRPKKGKLASAVAAVAAQKRTQG